MDYGVTLTLIERPVRRWPVLVASYAAQALALLLIVQVSILQAQKFTAITPKVFRVTALVSAQPHHPRAAHRVAPVNLRPALLTPRSVPLPESAHAVTFHQPRVVLTHLTEVPRLPEVRLQAPPPPRLVQTGGFGDTNGVKASAKATAEQNISQLGSFDLPAGPGQGAGRGGSRGIKSNVVSAGFGNGVAGGTGTGSGSAGRGVINQSGFGDMRVAQPTVASRPVASNEPAFTAVQILSKPDPVYTDEARKLRLEGEVVLEVEFSAAGQCHVQRVVSGLGHGLDEAAIRAAREIRFRPAKRYGESVDFSAKIKVLFQLAY